MKTQIPEMIAVGLTRGEYGDLPVWGFVSDRSWSSGFQGPRNSWQDQCFWEAVACAKPFCVLPGAVGPSRGISVVRGSIRVCKKTGGFESWLDYLPTA